MGRLRRWLCLIVLGLFFFMIIVDGSIVTIAIPVLAQAFQIGTSQANLIIGIYLIIISALLLPFGQLGNQFGRTRLFQIGMIVFLVGSWFAGASQQLLIILLARGCQAIGASMVMANSYAIVTDLFPPTELGRAFGVESVFISIGGLAGPGLGGLLIHYWGWRYIFWCNLPIGIICVGLAWWLFNQPHQVTSTGPFDWGGLFLLLAMATSFYSMSSLMMNRPQLAGSLLGIFIIGFALFWQHEQRVAVPLLNVSLLKEPVLRLPTLAAFFSFIAAYFFTLLAPIYLQLVVALPSQLTGLILMAAPIIAIFANPLAGILTDHFSRINVMRSGMLILVIAGAGLLTLNGNHEPWAVLGWSGLSAIGTALFSTANNTFIMASATAEQRGMIGAITSLVREFGLVLGTSLVGLTFYGKLSLLKGNLVANAINQPRPALIDAQHFAYALALVLLLIAFRYIKQLERK